MRVDKLLNTYGIKYNLLDIYIEALTHASSTNEIPNTTNYERLEFLGDSLINFFVAEYLFTKNDNLTEGAMTVMRASYVREDALYQYACKLELNKYIIVGGSEKNISKSIVADVVEAFLAAIYLDLGFDTCRNFFKNHIAPIIEEVKMTLKIDYKTQLQELVQTGQKRVEYFLVSESGSSHSKKFVYDVILENIKLGSGRGSSKKEAQQKAAESALKKLAK